MRIPPGPCFLLALFLFLSSCSKEGDDPPPPTITLSAPTGGEFWAGTKDIAWTASGTPPLSVNIELSTDSGANWILIAVGELGTGTYPWDTTTRADCQTCRIRVKAVDTNGKRSFWSGSTDDFRVDNGDPTLTLTAPVGGEVWGGTRNITWTTTDASPTTIAVEISSNSGGSWTPLASGFTDNGFHAWVTSAHADGSTYRVRVRATDAAGNTSTWSASPADMELDNTAPGVALTSPVGGEIWFGTHNITWNTTDANPDLVSIEISPNSGGTWTPLVTGIADTGSHAWDTSTQSDGPNVRVRVRVTDGAGNISPWSASGSDVLVDNTAPTILLFSPAGGEAWAGTQTITWTTIDVHPATVLIEISSDSGLSWSTLAATAPDTGTYSWDTTAHALGTHYRIRVTATDMAGHGSNTSASVADFTLLRYGWARMMAGVNSGGTGYGVVTDTSGNVYVSGSFSGTIDFQQDFGGGADSKSDAGAGDGFITKINSDGSYGWTRRFGTFLADWADGIVTDASGNVYVTGRFQGTVDFRQDFGGGSDVKTSAGHNDIFLLRINADGSYGWTRRMGGSDMNGDWAKDICMDGSGNIYLSGIFHGTVDFRADWGGGTDVKNSVGIQDVFVTRVNADGSYGWTRAMGGTTGDLGEGGIATDGSGNIYTAGTYFGTVDFRADWGGGTDVKTHAGGGDAFITRINADGSYGWTRKVGAAGVERALGTATDGSGNIYVTGPFQGTVDFRADWGGGTDNKTSSGFDDIYVLRINADGSYGWTKRMGGTGGDRSEDIVTDGSGNLFITGFFGNTVDFRQDFSGGTDVKTSIAGTDICTTRINADGSYGWTKVFGGTSSNQGLALAVSSSGDVVVTGWFQGTLDFGADFGSADSKTTPAAGGQIFVAKFRY